MLGPDAHTEGLFPKLEEDQAQLAKTLRPSRTQR
jgi:hypothetical protein